MKFFYMSLLAVALNGCGILMMTGAVAVDAVGSVSYGIKKAGNVVAERSKMRFNQVASLFDDGTVVAEEPYTVEQVWESLKSVFIELKLKEVEGTYDALSGLLTAKSYQGKIIKTSLKQIEGGTEITILIGEDGDTDQSVMILNQLVQKLSALEKK